VTCKSFSL